MKRVGVLILGLCLIFCLTACGVQITDISLPENLELEAGTSEMLPLEYSAGDNSDADALANAAAKLTLTWASSDEAVATVDAEGKVTALAPGKCDVTVATEDGKLTAICRIVVLDPMASEDEDTDASKSEPGSEATDATDASSKTDSNMNSSTATDGKNVSGSSNNSGSSATGNENASGGNNTPAPTPAPAPDPTPAPPTGGDNTGTGNNPNEGGAIGGGNTTVPCDGSWAVDGGDAEFDDGAVPPPPVTNQASDSNVGTGSNPNEGGAIGGGNTTVPGDGSWAVDGGNAETVDRP